MSFQLLQQLNKEKDLQIIHLHTMGLIGGIARTIAKKRNIPLVVSLHGGVFDLPSEFLEYFKDQMRGSLSFARLFAPFLQPHHTLRDADAIITFNKKEMELLQKKYPAQRILHIPHGINTTPYQKDCRQHALEAYPEIRNKKLGLVAARIDPVKNQMWLIEQLQEIFKKEPDFILGFIGPCTNDEYQRKLKDRIRSMNLEEKVFLLGMLPPGDPRLAGLYQHAHVTLLPSIAEPFGLVILESWASGTPVIASNASGPADIICDGEDGYLFNLDKPDTFHRALNDLNDQANRSRIIKNSQSTLNKKYTIEASTSEVGKLYKSLM